MSDTKMHRFVVIVVLLGGGDDGELWCEMLVLNRNPVNSFSLFFYKVPSKYGAGKM